ncbi:MAG: pseudouridine synthase [Pseudomonadota bacterium]
MTTSPNDTSERERLAKRLARAGIASRRDAEALITSGRIAVNGKTIDTPAFTVTAADKITFDGAVVEDADITRLWRYHKPVGLVTSARDEKGRPTVFDRLPADLPRVMSIGRLDLTSEGLLLLTNDGALKRRLELPDTGWSRRYRVRAKGAASEAALARLRGGITLEDGTRFRPMGVSLDRTQGANSWLTITLTEGKNREIRRALETIDMIVNRLIRVSYGPFQLGELPTGEVEEVRGKTLRDQIGDSAVSGTRRAPAAPAKSESDAKPRRKPRTPMRGDDGQGFDKASRAGRKPKDVKEGRTRTPRANDGWDTAKPGGRMTDDASPRRGAGGARGMPKGGAPKDGAHTGSGSKGGGSKGGGSKGGGFRDSGPKVGGPKGRPDGAGSSEGASPRRRSATDPSRPLGPRRTKLGAKKPRR